MLRDRPYIGLAALGGNRVGLDEARLCQGGFVFLKGWLDDFGIRPHALQFKCDGAVVHTSAFHASRYFRGDLHAMDGYQIGYPYGFWLITRAAELKSPTTFAVCFQFADGHEFDHEVRLDQTGARDLVQYVCGTILGCLRSWKYEALAAESLAEPGSPNASIGHSLLALDAVTRSNLIYLYQGLNERLHRPAEAGLLSELFQLPTHPDIVDFELSMGTLPAANQPNLDVFVSTSSGSRARHMAKAVIGAFEAAGIDVTCHDENDPNRPGTQSPSERTWIFAPGEFFAHGAGRQLDSAHLCRVSTLVNTDQFFSEGFTNAFGHLLTAPLVVSSDVQTASLLRYLGIAALLLPLPKATRAEERYVPPLSLRALISGAQDDMVNSDTTPFEKRAFDFAFFGKLSPRQEDFFSSNAEFFSRFRTFFDFRMQDGPSAAANWTSEDRMYVARNSKVLIHIHASDTPDFDWQTIVLYGSARGALVVSEPNLALFGAPWAPCAVEKNIGEIAEYLEWLMSEGRDFAKLESVRRQNWTDSLFNGERCTAFLAALSCSDVR